jgi:hypothetical protein
MPDDITPHQRAATLLDLAGLPTDDVLVGRVATAIRAAEARGERRGAEREREACAKLADIEHEDPGDDVDAVLTRLAAAIRKRGEARP